MIDIEDEQLPKANPRRDKATEMEWKLRTEFRRTITIFQENNDYKFEPYEIDLVLLQMAVDHQRDYLNSKFGYTQL